MGALDSVRVIDFGHYVAGPLTGMLLADQGADVIKVDPPGGPVYDTPANRTWNRGKRSICLDLKLRSDVDIARSLIFRADVVIENFRPGVMSAFGLDEKKLRKQNPRLIYTRMPGFGSGDSRSGMAAWEGTILAATDVFRPIREYRDMVQLLHQPPSDRQGTPVFTAEPVASIYAAMISALAITTALHVRNSTGTGQSIEVPLFDAMLQAVGIMAMSRLPFKPVTSSVFSGFDHQYQCADNRWVHIICTVPRHGVRFLEAIGRQDLIDKGLAERGLGARPELNKLLVETLTETFSTRAAIEWEKLFVKLKIPGVMCRSSAEWLDHTTANDTDLLVEIDDPVLGSMRQPGLQVKLSATPGEVSRPAPLPDEHRAEIFELLTNNTTKDIGKKETATATEFPLEGLRVLDLCIILAGPTCGRSLAELGADVIKIDDPTRGEVLYHHDINRGKRSLLLDLKTPAGMELFWKLVDSADVIVQNYRSGVVEELGIDYESIRQRKPDIIYASLNAFGDTGPWEELPGYEEAAQALTGIQVRYGGAEKPILWPYGVINDYGTGFAGAFGVLMAILSRSKTGEGQHVTSALARTACTIQSAYLQDYEGKVWDEPQGPDCLGFSPIQRLYQCQDGWIYLGGKKTSDVAGIINAKDDETLEESITQWCHTRSIDDAVNLLNIGSTGAHKLEWINDFASDKQVQDRDLIITREHGSLGLLRTTGPGHWFSESKIHAGCSAPMAGEDAESVLSDIFRDDLAELVAAGVISVFGK